MQSFIASFWNDESGTTAIEYATLGGFIALTILIALEATSLKVHDLYALIVWPK